MWGDQILGKMLKIHKINVYWIALEVHIFHKLEFYMFNFVCVYYIHFKVTFVGVVPQTKKI